MALPDVSTFTLNFGPYTDAEGLAALVASGGKLFFVDPSTNRKIRLTHVTSGQVIVPDPVSITIASDGTGSVGPIPHTGQAAFSPQGAALRVEWNIASNKPSPGNLTFVVPSGATADFDLLVPADTIPAVAISQPTVASVNGHTGAVVLDAEDVGAATPADLSDGLATKVNSSTYTAGLAAKADITDPRIAAPAHAGARTGHYDPTRSIYNLKASNTRRLRATLAAARAGTGLCRTSFVGDSLMAGYGNTRGVDDPVSLLGGFLTRDGYSVGELVHSYTNGVAEPRITATGAAWPGGVSIIFPWPGFTGTGGTYTHTGTGTVCEIITTDVTGTGFTYSIDGGAAVTYTPGGTNQPRVITVTGLSSGSHTLTITSGSGTTYVHAAGFRPATGIVLENAGISGSSPADWGANWSNFGPAWSIFNENNNKPDVVFMELGVNSLFQGVPVVNFRAHIDAILDAAIYFGATVILVASNYPSGADATWPAYVSAIYDAADEYDLPLLDLADRFGVFSQYNADGLGYDEASDTIHLTAAGNAHKAHAMAQVLAA